MNGNVRIKHFGRFKIVIENKEKQTKVVHDWQDNVVLKKVFSAHAAVYSVVTLNLWLGTGSTTPTSSDSGLVSPTHMIAGSYQQKGNRMSTTVNRSTGIMKYTTEQVFTGSTGQVVGNISELGMSVLGGSYEDTYVFTRALIKDSEGNPTTITLGEFDKLTLYYDYGWEFDLRQELLNTTFDYKGVSTNVIAKFVDWNMSPIPASYAWADIVYEPHTQTNARRNYAMIPSEYGAVGKLSTGEYLALMGSTNPEISPIDTTDVSNFSKQNTRLASLSRGSFTSTATANSLTVAMSESEVIPAGTASGYITALLASSTPNPTSSYNGGRVAYMFNPPLEKLASDSITIEALSVSFVVE